MKVMERKSNLLFVCQFKQPECFLPRCFASLFPYGRGCPSDKASPITNIRKHTAHILCLGGGPNPRRFQQSSKYIFTMYIMEMKRTIGGIAYAAQRSKLNGKPIVDEKNLTVRDVNDLLLYLNNSNEDTDNSTEVLPSRAK